ncbi:MAG TPA: hypothetical protein VMZ51_09170 [Acidimicrobiales bacterium]|nr:hypothetical protein [Acidimicrobiales bacterium]
MARIRASCPECGDVELTIDQVRVVVCSSDNQGSYSFQCPSCRLAITKAAQPRVIDVLLASGVALTFWSMPAELDEAHDGPPICHDDLLVFHFDLERGDCMTELTGAGVQMQGSRSSS